MFLTLGHHCCRRRHGCQPPSQGSLRGCLRLLCLQKPNRLPSLVLSFSPLHNWQTVSFSAKASLPALASSEMVRKKDINDIFSLSFCGVLDRPETATPSCTMLDFWEFDTFNLQNLPTVIQITLHVHFYDFVWENIIHTYICSKKPSIYHNNDLRKQFWIENSIQFIHRQNNDLLISI